LAKVLSANCVTDWACDGTVQLTIGVLVESLLQGGFGHGAG
jgi:hypothetical protein